MEYRSLGRTGVQVSQICLGTMMFGGRTDQAESLRIIDHALDNGVNFVDTADVYAGNESERIVGEAQPGVTAPIIGPRTLAQVADNLGAVKVQLDSADFERIDALAPPRSVAVRYYDRAIALDFRPHSHRTVV